MTDQQWQKVFVYGDLKAQFPHREDLLRFFKQQKEEERLPFGAHTLYEALKNTAAAIGKEDEADFEPFEELPAEERARRHQLSQRARMAIAKRGADKIYSNIPGTSLRYVADVVLKRHQFPEEGQPETEAMRTYNRQVDEENAHTIEVFNHMDEHRSEALSLYVDMFKKWEDYDPLEFISRDVSDEEIVCNFERINYICSVCTQFSNVINDLKAKGITRESLDTQIADLSAKENPTEAEQAALTSLREDKKKLDYVYEVEAKYSIFGESFYQLDARMGLIDSPYYEIVDMTSPNVRKAFGFWQNNEMDIDTLEIPGDEIRSENVSRSLGLSNHSDTVSTNMKQLGDHFWRGEYLAAREKLLQNGASIENLVFKIGDDGDETACADDTLFVRNATDAIADKTVAVYDKTNPQNTVTLSATTSLLQQLAHEKQLETPRKPFDLPKYPAPPAPVSRPVDPSPSFGKRFWYTVSFHNAYSAEMETYLKAAKPQYEKELARYQQYLRDVADYNAEKAAIAAYRQKYVTEHPDDVRAMRTMELDKEPADVVPLTESRMPEAVEAKTRTPHPATAGGKTVDNVFGAEFAAPTETLEEPMPERIATGHIKEVFKSLAENCGLLLGTDAQARLYYLDLDNRMYSFENVDLFNPKEQVRFLQMFHSNRLFAIPAGETTPVQLQLLDRTSHHGVMYADNLGRPPKAPNVNRFSARFFGRNNAQLDTYKAALKQSARAVSVRAEIDRITCERLEKGFDRRALSDVKPAQGSPADTEKKVTAELLLGEQRTQSLLKHFSEVEKAVEHAEKVKQLRAELGQERHAQTALRDIYGSKPTFRDYMVEHRCYSKEGFQKLKTLDCGLLPAGSPLEAGENGLLKLTEDDFVALASSATMLPELAKDILKEQPSIASCPEGREILDLLRPEACFDMNAAMLRNDICKSFVAGEGWIGRDSLHNFFGNAIEPAREKTAAAVKAYAAGDRAPLAKIITCNMLEFRRAGARCEFSSVGLRAVDHLYARCVRMMEADPALKTAVENELNGFKKQANSDLKSYTAQREALRRENPEFEKLRELHLQCGTSKEAAAAYRAAMKTHSDYAGLLLKDNALAINQAYAKQTMVTNLNEVTAQIKAREKVGDIYASAKLEREKIAVAVAENVEPTAQQKEACLKTVLKEEVLLRHDHAFRRLSEEKGSSNEISRDPSVAAILPASYTHLDPGHLMLASELCTLSIHANQMVSSAFSKLYIDLGEAKDASAMLDETVDRIVPPEQQQALWETDVATLQKTVKKPCALMNNAVADEIGRQHAETYAQELARNDAQRELVTLTFDDEPEPDASPSMNVPMA